MNPSSNPSGDPGWVTHNWDHNNVNNNNNNNSTVQSAAAGAVRPPEWDWENPMLLVQNPTAAAAGTAATHEVKPQLLVSSLPTASLCNRPYAAVSNYSASAIPHSFSHHNNNAVANMNPTSMRLSYGGLQDGYSNLHQGQGIYGQTAATPPSDLNAELRSYDQRRRFLGMHMLENEQRNVLDFVKREEMYSLEPHARIGLNLGGRTYFSAEDSARLGKRTRMNALGAHAPMCQVQGCTADLSKAKHYHRRHKVCEIHSKAPNVVANGQTQRFCQQCSRFHQLTEFDDTKRSCRKRLADHNRRRRKPQHSAVATISDSSKTEEQSTNLRTIQGADHKPPLLLHMQKSGSPTASVTDRDSISSGGNRLQVQQQQSTSFGRIDEKLTRNPLLRAQAIPSSDVQALVLSVVSRTPSSAALHSSRQQQSSGTQESVYQHYLHGPSLSLSSAGMNAQTHHHHHQQQQQQNSPSSQHSAPWLSSCSNSRSTLVQAYPAGRSNLQNLGRSQQYLLHGTGEQLGRLGLQGTAMDGHQMLALIENPAQQQQLTSSVDDVKPLHHSEMQSSGVRSSFGSSFYDSSSSIG